ncbi:MAG: helix-turn-helix domain-containing protein [Ornithinimicrobium sp.]
MNSSSRRGGSGTHARLTHRRSYADPCGVARALDAVGERWALLVVRELSLGPQRFGQLLIGLPDVSPNVLSQRLRDLEDAGVLRRYPLDPPANTTVYELTDQGYALDPVLQALGRWGASRPMTTTREMSAVSFLRSLRVLLAPHAPDGEYGLQLDGESFALSIAGGTAQVTRGKPRHPEATLSGDVHAVRTALLSGGSLRELESAGSLTISGDRPAAERLTTQFRVPPR